MRPVIVWTIAAVAAAVAIVAWGRHERVHAIRVEQQRLLAVRDAVASGMSRPDMTLYNAPLEFTCAVYGRDELCFDPTHRLVEAVASGSVATVRWDRAASPWAMPAATWHRVFPKQPAPSYYP